MTRDPLPPAPAQAPARPSWPGSSRPPGQQRAATGPRDKPGDDAERCGDDAESTGDHARKAAAPPTDPAYIVAAAVEDPELPPLTIADLGILRAVRHDGGTVEVTITPTYSGCPAMREIASAIETALHDAGFPDVRVRTSLTPAWTTDALTAEARRKLKALGIAPPEPGHPAQTLFANRQVPCPRCGSLATERLAAFGATACKALHRCLSCREPFEAFKCH